MSKIYLLKDIDLDITQEHTIDFENVDAQTAYFESHIFTSWDSTLGFSYLRENMPIKCPKNKDTLFGCNYLMYKNDTLNKWFYCFITRKEYIAEDCTKLYIKTDPMQTFMFDYSLLPSFIEREHQDRWMRHEQTNYLRPLFSQTSEDIATGDKYILSSSESIKSKTENDLGISVKYLLIACSAKIDSFEGGMSTGYPPVDPLIYYILPIVPYTTADYYFFMDNKALQHASGLINAAKEYGPSIVSMQIIDYFPGVSFSVKDTSITGHYEYYINITSELFDGPVPLQNSDYYLLRLRQGIAESYTTVGSAYIKSFNNITFDKLSINNKASIENETKLKQAPYELHKLTNYSSEGLVIDLNGLDIFSFDPTKGYKLNIDMTWSPDPNYKACFTIDKYFGDSTGKLYNIVDNSVNDLPILKNEWYEYYARNKASAIAGVAVNLAGGIAKAGISAATGMSASAMSNSAPAIARASGASAGGIIGMFENIANAAMNIYDIQNTPDTLKKEGNNAKYNLTRTGASKMRLDKYRIQSNFRQLVYQYFLHFGYKCQRIKTPNLKSRYYYNFIKTTNVELASNIDQEYIDEIKTIYDKGITFWHYRDATTFKGIGNYEYENCEMSILEAQS